MSSCDPYIFYIQWFEDDRSNNVAVVSGIGPVSTILQAHFVLGEKLVMAQVIGTLLVIAGVLLTGWRNRDI